MAGIAVATRPPGLRRLSNKTSCCNIPIRFDHARKGWFISNSRFIKVYTVPAPPDIGPLECCKPREPRKPTDENWRCTRTLVRTYSSLRAYRSVWPSQVLPSGEWALKGFFLSRGCVVWTTLNSSTRRLPDGLSRRRTWSTKAPWKDDRETHEGHTTNRHWNLRVSNTRQTRIIPKYHDNPKRNINQVLHNNCGAYRVMFWLYDFMITSCR